jgi:hypothetical protein
MKVLVAVRLPGADVHEVIQAHRTYVVQLMQEWTRLKDDEADLDLAFALVVDAELFRLESVIRWLDEAEGRLRRAAEQGWPPERAIPVSTAVLQRRRRIGARGAEPAALARQPLE